MTKWGISLFICLEIEPELWSYCCYDGLFPVISDGLWKKAFFCAENVLGTGRHFEFWLRD